MKPNSFALAFAAALALLALAPRSPVVPALAQTAARMAGSAAVDTDAGWPRTIVSAGATLLLYQPQVEGWTGNRLSACAAVAVNADSSRPSTYGVITLTARTEVDKVNRLVTLDDFRITGINFPTAGSEAARYRDILQSAANGKARTIALDRILADLAMTEGQNAASGYDLQNEPPQIIFSISPAVLVLIDGEPALRPVEGLSGFQRVINTRALLLYDQQADLYHLYLMGGWVTAGSLQGPWILDPQPPAALSRLRDQLAAAGEVDLLTDAAADDADAVPTAPLTAATVPAIYVSTAPAELLQTQGEPQFIPVPGTRLLYVSNTGSDLFMNTADQSYYVLISGRWFRSRALNGPWDYVAGTNLPADFARIPPTSPKAGVLVSVPGTPQAQEALIADQVPQTATITRSGTHLTVAYDGQPQLVPIEGTALSYAVNSPTPVIEVEPGSYYAVCNGVWFVANAPQGPWEVATVVPAAIYSIPPDCPIHYVTYVRIYGYTPTVVYCGYTPGYYGTVISSDGVVVYGTGWVYSPYIGHIWIGAPWTYGCGAGFGWSPGAGWYFNFGIGYHYPIYRPWYGPLHWGWRPHANWHPAWGHHGWGGFSSVNAYGRWNGAAVIHTPAVWAHARPGSMGGNVPGGYNDPRTGIIIRNPRPAPRLNSGVRTPPRPNPMGVPRSNPPGTPRPTSKPNPGAGTPPRIGDLYGTQDGRVYRYRPGGGWQQQGPVRRQPVPTPAPTQQLNRQQQGRILGEQRWQNFPGRGGPAPVPHPTPSVGTRGGPGQAPRPESGGKGGGSRRG